MERFAGRLRVSNRSLSSSAEKSYDSDLGDWILQQVCSPPKAGQPNVTSAGSDWPEASPSTHPSVERASTLPKVSDTLVKVWSQVPNFEVYYDWDRTTVTHLISPDNYNADGNNLDPIGSWVSLSCNTPMVLAPPCIPFSDASSPSEDGSDVSDREYLDDGHGCEKDSLDRSVDSLIRAEKVRT